MHNKDIIHGYLDLASEALAKWKELKEISAILRDAHVHFRWAGPLKIQVFYKHKSYFIFNEESGLEVLHLPKLPCQTECSPKGSQTWSHLRIRTPQKLTKTGPTTWSYQIGWIIYSSFLNDSEARLASLTMDWTLWSFVFFMLFLFYNDRCRVITFYFLFFISTDRRRGHSFEVLRVEAPDKTDTQGRANSSVLLVDPSRDIGYLIVLYAAHKWF